MLLGVISLLIGQFFGNSIVPIGTKIASPFTGPLIFVFLRVVLGVILLSVIYLFSKKKKIKKYEYKDFALLGFFLMINVALFTIAIAYTTVIMSTLIYSITPIFVGIGAYFFLQETFDKRKVFGLFISFIGLLFLISQSFSGIQKNTFGEPLGNILIFFSMLGYSYYLIHSRKVLYKKDNFPIQTTFLTFTFTAFFVYYFSFCYFFWEN
jgi:drug/metabolite transporter (DMT)-like permease